MVRDGVITDLRLAICDCNGCLHDVIRSRCGLPVLSRTGRNHPAQLPMPMRQEPAAHGQPDAAQNQQLIADHQAGQDHERHTAEHQRRTGRHAADNRLERRPHQRCQAEHEQPHAHPHNALEA